MFTCKLSSFAATFNYLKVPSWPCTLVRQLSDSRDAACGDAHASAWTAEGGDAASYVSTEGFHFEPPWLLRRYCRLAMRIRLKGQASGRPAISRSMYGYRIIWRTATRVASQARTAHPDLRHTRSSQRRHRSRHQSPGRWGADGCRSASGAAIAGAF